MDRESVEIGEVKTVAPPRSRPQSMLQAAVQSVQWTYSLFWQLCPQKGILVWSDGYYNGAIKTRKTVQPTEVTTEEEATQQRSRQLRELYESLIFDESDHQSQRPSATLSPEDLTESEWFYLLCFSFSFRRGCGLPGKAYEKQQHIWLAGANEVDSKLCPRVILAKSARIQTLVCIPMDNGVVELGTIELVEEDIGLVQHIESLLSDYRLKPAISDHSTSNIPSISFQPRLNSPVTRPIVPPPRDDPNVVQDEDESRGVDGSDCEAADANELMEQLGMYVDLDFDLDLDSDSDCLAGRTEPENSSELHRPHALQDNTSRSLQPSHTGISSFHETTQEDTHYSSTVSTILQSTRWANSSSAAISSASTAFSKYSTSASRRRPHYGSSQWALKYVLFTVPLLHVKSHNPTSDDSSVRLREDTVSAAQEELCGSHVLSERRRREKLNERFEILRSLVPFVTKMDKASILGDTIDYLKHLCEKIQELEAQKREMEAEEKQKNSKDHTEKRGWPLLSLRNKKKRRIMEDGGEKKNAAARVEVSIIESDALVQIQCLHKEGLLINVIQMLRKFRVEVTAVQSSVENEIFAAELRAKVEENMNGRKASIMEVKRAVNRIIYSSKPLTQ